MLRKCFNILYNTFINVYKFFKNKFPNKYWYVILSFIFIVACYKTYRIYFTGSEQSHTLKIVEVMQVKKSVFSKYVTLIGTVRAKQSSKLVSKSVGVFHKLCPIGAAVKKGDKIGRLLNDPIEKNFILSETSKKIAQDQYDRVVSLEKKGAVSKQMVDEKKTMLLSAKIEFEKARLSYENTLFLAPFDGIVGTYLVNDGSEIQENIMVAMFYDISSCYVEFDIPAPLLSQLIDQPEVKIGAFSYTLPYVQRIVDEHTHMSPARIEIKNNQVTVGTMVDVDLCVVRKENVLVIPDGAIFLENAKSHVYVVNNDKVFLREIEVGHKYQDKVEVIKGIEENDIIVIENPTRLQDDLPVLIAKNNLPSQM